MHSSDLTTADVLLRADRDGRAQLMRVPPKSCGSCGMCSSATVAHPQPGQLYMTLGLPVNSLLYAAFALYGVPLAGLVVGALIASVLGAGDLGALVGSVSGGLAAAVFSRRGAAGLEKRVVSQLSVMSLRSGAEDAWR